MSRLLVPCLVVAATLTATICWEVRSVVQTSSSATAGLKRPPAEPLTTAVAATADPVDAWAGTALERPLMREGRRPASAPGDLQRNGDDIPRLAAVMTGPFGNRAIFIVPGTAKPVIAKVGAEVSDFVVRSIEPGWVVADAAGVSRVYKPLHAAKTR